MGFIQEAVFVGEDDVTLCFVKLEDPNGEIFIGRTRTGIFHRSGMRASDVTWEEKYIRDPFKGLRKRKCRIFHSNVQGHLYFGSDISPEIRNKLVSKEKEVEVLKNLVSKLNSLVHTTNNDSRLKEEVLKLIEFTHKDIKKAQGYVPQYDIGGGPFQRGLPTPGTLFPSNEGE